MSVGTYPKNMSLSTFKCEATGVDFRLISEKWRDQNPYSQNGGDDMIKKDIRELDLNEIDERIAKIKKWILIDGINLNYILRYYEKRRKFILNKMEKD